VETGGVLGLDVSYGAVGHDTSTFADIGVSHDAESFSGGLSQRATGEDWTVRENDFNHFSDRAQSSQMTPLGMAAISGVGTSTHSDYGTSTESSVTHGSDATVQSPSGVTGGETSSNAFTAFENSFESHSNLAGTSVVE